MNTTAGLRPGTGEPFSLDKELEILDEQRRERENGDKSSMRAPCVPTTYYITRVMFLRFISAIFLVAFSSLLVQLPGLIGSNGLLPAFQSLSTSGVPNLAGVFGSDPVVVDLWLDVICILGMFLSGVGVVGMVSVPSMLACWLLYLSLMVAGQTFANFQWDNLLLEVGFISVFMAPMIPTKTASGRPPSLLVILFLRFVFFKVVLMTGASKIENRDPAWIGLTALNAQFAKQCLPTPVAWYFSILPEWLLQLGVALVYIIEIPMAFFILTPFRTVRHMVAVVQIILQILVMISGNYGFYNLLCIALSFLLIDDSLWLFLLRFNAEAEENGLSADKIGLESTPLTSLPVHAAAYGTQTDEDSGDFIGDANRRDSRNNPCGSVLQFCDWMDTYDNMQWAICIAMVQLLAMIAVFFMFTVNTEDDNESWIKLAFGREDLVSFLSAILPWTIILFTAGLGFVAVVEVSQRMSSLSRHRTSGAYADNIVTFAFIILAFFLIVANWAVLQNIGRFSTPIDLLAVPKDYRAGVGLGAPGTSAASLSRHVAMPYLRDPGPDPNEAPPPGVSLSNEPAPGEFAGEFPAISRTLHDKHNVWRALGSGIARAERKVHGAMKAAQQRTGGGEGEMTGRTLSFAVYDVLRPFRFINSYGLFSGMTDAGYGSDVTARPEILLEVNGDEACKDGAGVWEPVEFRYKVGNVMQSPPWAAPHTPRLDMQMWFAALQDDWTTSGWLITFAEKLLHGSSSVLSLVHPLSQPAHCVRFSKANFFFTPLRNGKAASFVEGEAKSYNESEVEYAQWWTYTEPESLSGPLSLEDFDCEPKPECALPALSGPARRLLFESHDTPVDSSTSFTKFITSGSKSMVDTVLKGAGISPNTLNRAGRANDAGRAHDARRSDSSVAVASVQGPDALDSAKTIAGINEEVTEAPHDAAAIDQVANLGKHTASAIEEAGKRVPTKQGHNADSIDAVISDDDHALPDSIVGDEKEGKKVLRDTWKKGGSKKDTWDAVVSKDGHALADTIVGGEKEGRKVLRETWKKGEKVGEHWWHHSLVKDAKAVGHVLSASANTVAHAWHWHYGDRKSDSTKAKTSATPTSDSSLTSSSNVHESSTVKRHSHASNPTHDSWQDTVENSDGSAAAIDGNHKSEQAVAAHKSAQEHDATRADASSTQTVPVAENVGSDTLSKGLKSVSRSVSGTLSSAVAAGGDSLSKGLSSLTHLTDEIQQHLLSPHRLHPVSTKPRVHGATAGAGKDDDKERQIQLEKAIEEDRARIRRERRFKEIERQTRQREGRERELKRESGRRSESESSDQTYAGQAEKAMHARKNALLHLGMEKMPKEKSDFSHHAHGLGADSPMGVLWKDSGNTLAKDVRWVEANGASQLQGWVDMGNSTNATTKKSSTAPGFWDTWGTGIIPLFLREWVVIIFWVVLSFLVLEDMCSFVDWDKLIEVLGADEHDGTVKAAFAIPVVILVVAVCSRLLGLHAVGLIILALLGLIIANYIMNVDLQLNEGDDGVGMVAPCDLTNDVSCTRAVRSEHSKIVFGVKNAIFGCVGYLAIIAFALVHMLTDMYWPVLLALLIAFCATVASLYLLHVSLMVMRNLCPICMASHAVNFALLWLAMTYCADMRKI